MGNCKSVTRVNEIEPTDKIQVMIRELRNDNNNGDLHNNMGKIFYENVRLYLSRQAKYKEAEYHLCKAISLGCTNFNTFYYLGNINEYIGNSEIALNYYLKASEIDSQHTDSLFKIGTLYVAENNFKSAICYFQKVYEKCCTDVFNINMLGLCMLNTVIVF
jgi:tetratricopeptide (TPR) repeat protein